MVEKKIIEELFEQPSKDFANHLKLQDNHRIILSGRYGIGKTTFLKHFFSSDSSAKDLTGKYYNPVHLFPINYPVANNEDIFEYIKYDIIAHLLSVEEIKFETIDIPYLQSLPNFLLRRPADVIAPILHFFGGAGRAYDNWKKLIDEFVEQHEDQQVDDKKVMLDFLEQMEKTSGGIYENDFYTELISKLLVQWKEVSIQKDKEDNENSEDQESNVENILIIDDLDRIDPAHIFRLFNIFAAHFDLDSHANKFGFDKIIFVCDIENIRNIFHNNYGTYINFTGYIDKFYSKKVYNFDNSDAISNILDNLISDIKFSDHNFIKKFGDQEIKRDLSYILIIMVKTGAVNLRSLLKFQDSQVSIKNIKSISYSNGRKYYAWKLRIVTLIDILVEFFGYVNELRVAFEKCQLFTNYNETEIDPRRNIIIIRDVVSLIGYDKDFLQIEEYGLKLTYKIKDHHYDGIWTEDLQILDNNDEKAEDMPNVFFMCLKALELLVNKGYFK